MRIVILGSSGMLGSMLYEYLSLDKSKEVYGFARRGNLLQAKFEPNRFLFDRDIFSDDVLAWLKFISPDLIINCIGVIKQSGQDTSTSNMFAINALWPHRLKRYAEICKSRLMHISTDCVFSGDKGQYTEADLADARDVYGLTKYLGEVDGEQVLTIRTSIIGHEKLNKSSLLEWFLAQKKEVVGYGNAIFSGFSTLELAKIINQVIIKKPNLVGLYHLSSYPISKYDLLKIINEVYEKNISITLNESYTINRSLDSSRFKAVTNYQSPDWLSMISEMRKFHMGA